MSTAEDAYASRQHQPAGVVSRCSAMVVDILAIFVIVGSLYLGIAFVVLLVNPTAFRWPNLGPFFSVFWCLVVGTLYLTVGWATSGRTIGAALLGLRVVGPSRLLIRWAGALVRAVLCVIFPVGLFWCAVDSRRRSVQDLVLRTRVVYDWTQRVPVSEPE